MQLFANSCCCCVKSYLQKPFVHEVGLGLSKVLKKVLKKVNLLKKVLKKVNLLKKVLKKEPKKITFLTFIF